MTEQERINHHKYHITKEDRNFYYSDEARGLRLQVDYLKVEVKLKEAGVHDTIVIYGSARTAESDPMYKEARKLGAMIGKSGKGPDDNHVMLMTGGGPGIMEAANRGAYDVGAKSIGLNITLPHEQFPNPYITESLCFQFYYFGIRKLHFMQRAKALIVFPGGFGTLDELFDLLTLIQTKKSPLIPIVLVSKYYWSNVINFDFLVKQGVIKAEDLELFTYVESAKEAWLAVNAWYKVREITLF